MGYYLNITDGKIHIELPKFYGYVDLYGLLSPDYLYDLGKIEATDIFYWSPDGPEFDLDPEQFRTFMDLYQKDIQQYHFSSGSIYYSDRDLYKHSPKLRDLYENNKTKHLDWY